MSNHHTTMTAEEAWAINIPVPKGCLQAETNLPCGAGTYTLYFDYLIDPTDLIKVRIIAYNKPVLVTYPDGEKEWQAVECYPYEKKIYVKQLRHVKQTKIN